MCYSVGGKDMVFVLMFLTASKSMWFSFDENLKSQRVELIFQETVARQSNCRLMLVQGLAGTQGRGCVWGASCSEVRGSLSFVTHSELLRKHKQSWVDSSRVRAGSGLSFLCCGDHSFESDLTQWSSEDLGEFTLHHWKGWKGGLQYYNLRFIPLVVVVGSLREESEIYLEVGASRVLKLKPP